MTSIRSEGLVSMINLSRLVLTLKMNFVWSTFVTLMLVAHTKIEIVVGITYAPSLNNDCKTTDECR